MKQTLKKLIGYLKCITNRIKYIENIYIGMDVNIVNRGRMELSSDIIIRPSSELFTHTKESKIIIGKGTEIGNHSTIASQNVVIIEDHVLTAPNVYIADHNHEYENSDIPICQQGVRCTSDSCIVIGSGTWLGRNVVVVGNVHIGKQCIIGANSVVTKDIPDYCVAVGAPAKVIKRYDFETRTWSKVI